MRNPSRPESETLSPRGRIYASNRPIPSWEAATLAARGGPYMPLTADCCGVRSLHSCRLRPRHELDWFRRLDVAHSAHVHGGLLPLVQLVFHQVLIARRGGVLRSRSNATPRSGSELSCPPGSRGNQAETRGKPRGRDSRESALLPRRLSRPERLITAAERLLAGRTAGVLQSFLRRRGLLPLGTRAPIVEGAFQ